MVKINYPKDTEQFHKEYENIFDEFDLSQIFCGKTVKEILTMSIEKIVNFKETNSFYNNCQDITTKKFFDYNLFQKKIAKFFMKYQKELNLSTCFYCNINYIYSFKNEYCNELDFVLYASKSELEKIISIGKKTSENIVKFRNENEIIDFISIPKKILTVAQKQNIKNNIEEQFNHFTIDHLIEKSTHPLFSLSLYNLIPSCSVCNSKFKHAKELVQNSDDLKFIPSYQNSSLNEDIKFQLYFDTDCEEVLKVDLDKIRVVLKDDDRIYRKYISTFKLYSRYQNHKHLVEDLIQKSTKYSSTKISQMAKLVNKTESEIKKDIFGKEIFEGELGDSPLTKLKRDVAKTIGVLK